MSKAFDDTLKRALDECEKRDGSDSTLLDLIRGGYKSSLGGRGEDHTVTIFFEKDDYLDAEALYEAITGKSND